MAVGKYPEPDDQEATRGHSDGEAHLQAQLDWLMSDDDPWSDLEEEPPCFCTARLRHKSASVLQARLTQAFPELQAVPSPRGQAAVELKWPEETFAWASWLDRPPSLRGAGEIRLAEDTAEIWTPTRGRMRQVLHVLLNLAEAQVELRELEIEDPFAALPMDQWDDGEDLNPEVDPEALDFLLGAAGLDDEGPDDDSGGEEVDEPAGSAEPPEPPAR